MGARRPRHSSRAPAQCSGGTWNCLNYYRTLKKPSSIIYLRSSTVHSRFQSLDRVLDARFLIRHHRHFFLLPHSIRRVLPVGDRVAERIRVPVRPEKPAIINSNEMSSVSCNNQLVSH